MNNSYTLFFVCPIGFEEIQAKELNKWLHHYNCLLFTLTVLKGGVEIISENLEIINIITSLKTTTKVLLRIDEFKVRDFPKLFNKVKKLNWAPYLYLNENLEVNVTLKKSRLIHSGRAKDSIEKGLSEWIKANPRKKIVGELPPQKIYFNINEDLCQVSIDLCGNPLYQRENKTQGAIAPIRENLASALILWSLEKTKEKDFNDFVDPMCGSGTFVHEAFQLNFAHQHKSLSAQFMPLTKNFFKLLSPNLAGFFKSYLGIDQNNFFNQGRQDNQKLNFINNNYQNVLNEIRQNSVIIFNPPYGKRIKIKGNIAEFYRQTLEHLFTTKPLMVGFIHPQEESIKFKQQGYQREDLLFKNGGLNVRYSLWYKLS